MPSGRRRAICSGIAPMPAAGRATSPSAIIRNTNSSIRLEAESERSSRIPPKNGRKKASIISAEKPSACSLSAADVSGSPEEVLERAAADAPPEARHAQAVGEGAHAGGERPPRALGPPPRVGELVEAGGAADERAGKERSKVERRVVEDATGLGVGGEQHLEAAIEPEALHDVGAHAPADAVRGLDDPHARSRLVEAEGAGEAGEASAHDHHVRPGVAHVVFPRTCRRAPSRSGNRKR